jgi:uncharacterized protein YkwD
MRRAAQPDHAHFRGVLHEHEPGLRALPAIAVFLSVVRFAGRWGLSLAIAAGGAVANAAPERAPQADRSRVAELVARQTNVFRATSKLPPLTVNPTLADAAQRFAEYMASTEQYGHEADGRQPAERARAQGYEHCMIAENIALQFSTLGFDTEELASRLVEGWVESPGHRRNLLLPQVVDIGIGIARSARTQRYYAVQLFGRPKSAAARFEIANRSDAPIRYELDAEAFTLPPRVTRTHQGCFSGTLKVVWPDGPASPGFEPRDGARYTVRRDQAGQLRLQTN